MFEVFRKHTKILMGVLVLLIIPSFVFFGMESYTQFNAREQAVAQVDGQKITQGEWDMAVEEAAARVRNQNPDVDIALFDTPEARYAALEQLVRERVMAAAALKGHLLVSDGQLAEYLSQDPNIQALRGADGKMDMQLYAEMLARQRLTPEQFEAGVRQQLAAQQVMLGVAGSTFAAPAQADITLDALRQVREVQVLPFESKSYAYKVEVTDDQLQAHYKANEAAFQRPESADIEYVELTLDALKAVVPVSEEDLRTYYESNKDRLGTPEERRASHILIEAPKGMPAEERAKLRAKADALHAELLKSPDSFAEVARRESQDAASAQNGGDLGFFTAQGAPVVDEVSQAAFAIKEKGGISPVIDADFGFDIVRLTDVKPSDAPPFESLRDKLEDQFRTEEAEKTFSAHADEMGKIAFEQRDSLKPIADKFKLTIKTLNGLANQRTQGLGVPAELTSPSFVEAVFNSDVTLNKGNTAAIPLGGMHAIVARVTRHEPAHTESFEKAKEQVREMFVAQESAKLALQAAEEARKDESTIQWPGAISVSREQPAGMASSVVEAALKADTKKLPVVSVVDLGAQGAALLKVNKVIAPEPLPADVLKQAQQQYTAGLSQAEMQAYYKTLMDRLKVKILVPDPNKQKMGN